MTRIKSITKARRIVPIEFRNQLLDNRRHGSVYRCLRSDLVSHRGDCAARDQFLNKVISTTDEFKAFLGKVDFTIGSVVQKELNDISIAIDDCEKKGAPQSKFTSSPSSIASRAEGLKHLSVLLIPQNSLCDFLGQNLAEPFSATTLAFPAIRDKAAFNEGGGATSFFKHLKAFRLKTPIPCDKAPSKLALNIAGQFSALFATGPIKGLCPTDAAVGVGIEMQADKDGFCRGIGHFRPVL